MSSEQLLIPEATMTKTIGPITGVLAAPVLLQEDVVSPSAVPQGCRRPRSRIHCLSATCFGSRRHPGRQAD
jgi:hypothetical protein